jgi:hypothetical protein
MSDAYRSRQSHSSHEIGNPTVAWAVSWLYIRGMVTCKSSIRL